MDNPYNLPLNTLEQRIKATSHKVDKFGNSERVLFVSDVLKLFEAELTAAKIEVVKEILDWMKPVKSLPRFQIEEYITALIAELEKKVAV